MKLGSEKKIAGILVPLFALRGNADLGVGDLGALREFIDWSADSGFHLVQLLPINETGGDNSPYNAISSMAIEPTTLLLAPGSPEDLTATDFAEVTNVFHPKRLRQGPVKHRRVKKLKRALLEKAFQKFLTDATEARRDQFAAFQSAEAGWLENYALFRVLMEANRGSEAWDTWTEEHRSIASARAWLAGLGKSKAARLEKRRQFFAYVQWIAYGQWADVKAYAEERSVALMGDIPFGVSYYSVDVFADPDEFELGWSGGAPPEPYFKDDDFTQKWGQNWGIPLYRWKAMRADGFAWWKRRVTGVRNVFHLFRIDHVIGFYRIYAFPWRPYENASFLPLDWGQMLERTGGKYPHFAPRDDSTHENAVENLREGEEYLRAILTECGETRLIGEDLGTVPNYVRPSLHSLGISGFKIPHWEIYEGRVAPGENHERLSVTTYATHDHKPVRALWEEAFEKPASTSDQARGEIWRIAEFAGFHHLSEQTNFNRDFYPAIIAALLRSNAWVAVIMITDLLGLKDRFNVPGTAANTNWTRRLRLSVDGLRSNWAVRKRMRLLQQLLEETGRA
jgi:4-alpha-glucanotransferase